jgi:hypothetical protein
VSATPTAGALTFEELRTRYPDPIPNPLLDTRRPWAERVAEASRHYCVGGALLRALGQERAQFPTIAEMARGLADRLGLDPLRERAALERTALAIANANDDGRIADAWALLADAMVEGRLVPEPAKPPPDLDPEAVDRWLEAADGDSSAETSRGGPEATVPLAVAREVASETEFA